MNFNIVAVGRMKSGPLSNIWDEYQKRLRWRVNIKEVVEKKDLKKNEMKKREAKLLEANLSQGFPTIAMDQNGEIFTSEKFSSCINNFQNNGHNQLNILIGGSDGLDKTILENCQLRIAMGLMTWPHMLARVMLIEQIYRSQCILDNHPYHK
jgi:23S rRNA (pseudouridine1915-N3)-methyltransferase|tara:strand:+ start:593 stop:1048 length:456 start_codon:yes stop_codon:yes gene_type:complete